MSDKRIRQVTDAQTLTALAHPLRRRLLDILTIDGPATASLLAERTDQAVGNVSHHLKTLAATELIEEAPELAKDRRERWWRKADETIRWSSSDFVDDPAAEAIERAAASMQLDRQAQYVRDWATADASEREWWGEGPTASNTWLKLTAAELEQLSGEIVALTTRWHNREVPDDGAERRPVLVFAHAIPARP